MNLLSTGHKRVRASKEYAGDFTYDAQGGSFIKWTSVDDSQTGSFAAITSTQKIRQLPHHGRIRVRKCLAIVVYGGVVHTCGERSERVSTGSLWSTSSWRSERENSGFFIAMSCLGKYVLFFANSLLSPRLCEMFQILHFSFRSTKLSWSSRLWNFLCYC